MHMAQGITTDKAITVMSSRERHLSNQRLFNVAVTRVRDAITMIVDDKEKLSRQLDMNPGNKTSALETLGRIDIDERRGSAPEAPFDPGRSEEHTSELQSLMRISYAVFCLKKKRNNTYISSSTHKYDTTTTS